MKKGQLILIPLIIAMTLLVVPIANAASPVKAKIIAETGAYTVGDPIQLTLSVTHPDDHTVILPELGESWGDAVVRSQSPATTVGNADGTETTSQVIDVRIFSPGTFTTPPLGITISDSKGDLSNAIADPIELTISSVLIEGDTQLRDIKPQIALSVSNLLALAVVGLAAAATGLGIALLGWRRRRARLALAGVDNRPPDRIALDELARIAELGLPERGRFKEHYTLVSDCIRAYGERIFDIPVLERTTGEVLTSLRQANVAQDVMRTFITFLDESDLVKFSTFRPDSASAYRLLDSGREIVELTRPDFSTSVPGISPSDPTTDDPRNGSDFPTRRVHTQSEVTL
jgi:hypothetical protein